MKKNCFFIAVIFTIALVSCKVTVEETLNSLNGTWRVSTLNGQNVLSKGATCIIDAEKKEAGGNSSCNTYGATLALDEKAKKIAFGSIVTTKIACQNSIETDYYAALPKVNSFEISDENVLRLKEGNTILIELIK